MKRIINTIIVRGGTAAGNFLLPLLVAKFYGLEELGLFATILSTITFLHIVLKFGMDRSLMREISKLKSINSLVILSLKTFFSLFIVLSICSIFLYLNFDLKFKDYLFYVYITSIPFTLLYLNSTVIIALGRADLGLFFTPGTSSLLMCVILYLLHNSLHLDNILHIYSYTLWILFSASALIAYKAVKNVNSDDVMDDSISKTDFIKSSLIFFVISFFIYSQQFSLTFTINFFESLETVGMIRYVEKVSLIFTFPLMIVVALFSPKFSYSFYNKDRTALRKSFKNAQKICLLSAILSILLIVILWLLFNDLIDGSNYDILIYAIPFLLSQFINLMTGPSDILLAMSGEEKLLLILTIGSGILSIISYYLLLEYSSLLIATYTLNFIYIIRNIVQNLYALKLIKTV